MRIIGTIENAYTEKLLPGAIVTLRVGDTELIENTPSKDGRFAYDIPDTAIPTGVDILTCTVEKRGYRTQTSTYAIPEGDIELALELVPRPINWWRILITVGIILGGLLLLGLIYFGIRYFFFSPRYPIKSFTVKPAEIDAGDTAEIAWETVKAHKIFLDEKEVKAKGTETVKPAKTRRYKLVIRDRHGKPAAQEWREIKVTQAPPEIISFTATPLEIDPWKSARLEWKTIGAESLYIRSEPENKNYRIDTQKVRKERTIIDEDYPEKAGKEPEAKEKGLNGSIEVFPLETTKFTLVAVNSQGVRREENVEVRVSMPPEILCFTSTGSVVDPGESVILNWETRGAEQVLLNDEKVAPKFSTEVKPTDTTTYKLIARNKVGERQNSITILMRCPADQGPPPPSGPPRIQRFYISDSEIAPGEPIVIGWVTDYAEKVYLISQRVEGEEPSPGSGAGTGKETAPDYPELFGSDPLEPNPKIPLEIIAGKPLETGTVLRVKPVDTIQVTPQVSTLYELRAVNPLKQLSWTRGVEVKAGMCTVVLYEYENYRGESMRFTADAATIGSMNNRVSSIKILGNCGVRVYSDTNFQATRQEFTRSVPGLRNTWIGNDTISSLKIITYKQELNDEKNHH